MSDKVKVRIQCTGRWQFCQDVVMTKAEFEKLDKQLDASDRKVRRRAEGIIEGSYINFSDIEIDDGIDLDDFHLIGTAP